MENNFLSMEEIFNNKKYKSGSEFTAFCEDCCGTVKEFSATLSREYYTPLLFFCIPSNYKILGYKDI